jgi:hypothetical protein
MTIETKFDIGQEVWFMEEDEPNSDVILSIEINIYKEKVFIEYLFANDSYPYGLDESILFPTKEELLKSMQV